jgi:hypothetical protein
LPRLAFFVGLVDLPSLAKIEPVAKDSELARTIDVAIAVTAIAMRVARDRPRVLLLSGSIFPPPSMA